jgi:hypothetical protein
MSAKLDLRLPGEQLLRTNPFVPRVPPDDVGALPAITGLAGDGRPPLAVGYRERTHHVKHLGGCT